MEEIRAHIAEVDRFRQILVRGSGIYNKFLDIYLGSSDDKDSDTNGDKSNKYKFSKGYKPSVVDKGLRDNFWKEVTKSYQYGFDLSDFQIYCGLCSYYSWVSRLGSDDFCIYLANGEDSSYEDHVNKYLDMGKGLVYEEILEKSVDEVSDIAEWTKVMRLKLDVLKRLEVLNNIGVTDNSIKIGIGINNGKGSVGIGLSSGIDSNKSLGVSGYRDAIKKLEEELGLDCTEDSNDNTSNNKSNSLAIIDAEYSELLNESSKEKRRAI